MNRSVAAVAAAVLGTVGLVAVANTASPAALYACSFDASALSCTATTAPTVTVTQTQSETVTASPSPTPSPTVTPSPSVTPSTSPTSTGTLFGTNIYGTGTPAQALAKWPKAKAFRQFFGDVPFASITIPAVGLYAPSFKPSDMAGIAAGTHRADLLAFQANVHRVGTPVRLIVWHELDAKLNSGALPTSFIPGWLAVQKYLVDFFATDPLITVSVVLTEYTLTNPTAGRTYETFMVPGLKSMGFDFDGSRPTTTNYVDYTAGATAMAAVKAKHGVDVWVPEYGVPLASNGSDASGVARGVWFTKTTPLLVKDGASVVDLFDTAPEGPLTDKPSLTAYEAFM